MSINLVQFHCEGNSIIVTMQEYYRSHNVLLHAINVRVWLPFSSRKICNRLQQPVKEDRESHKQLSPRMSCRSSANVCLANVDNFRKGTNKILSQS